LFTSNQEYNCCKELRLILVLSSHIKELTWRYAKNN